MQQYDTTAATGFFDLLGGTGRSQAATVTLGPGQSTGAPENAHDASDQWLYVVSTGTATVEAETHDLRAGSLVLLEAGETHEITNDGTEPLATINVYAPPAY